MDLKERFVRDGCNIYNNQEINEILLNQCFIPSVIPILHSKIFLYRSSFIFGTKHFFLCIVIRQ